MPPDTETAALPPLEWLRVFEAAGRSGSFTAAAAELGLTQAAVSQRIRHLEARLGVRLFMRLPRGVELSADGEAWLPHVQNALSALQRSTADLFGAPRRKLTIAAPASVAELWIAPRLAPLAATFPQLQVSVATVHRPADYAAADADFEIRFGAGDWPGRRAVRLYDEILAPALAPALLDGGAPDWRDLPQIAVSGPRDGWREWAAATGVAPPRPPFLRFDSFAPALAAAIDGAGVLLASLALARPALAAGRLVRLPERPLRMERGYWISWAAGRTAVAEHEAIVAALAERNDPAGAGSR